MTTIDILLIVAALVGGALLGLFCFGGLWWTVRRLPTAKSPALLMLGSLLLRSAITVGGILLVSWGHVERIIAAMVSFTVVSFVLRKRLGPDAVAADTDRGGDAHA